MASFSDTKITPANGQKIPTVDGSTTGYTETQDIKDYILASKAQPNGIATLDENGKLPSTQLPDLANDVLSFDSYSLLPSVGADGVLYIVKDTNKLYRWDGSQYVSVNTDTTELEERVDALETSSADHGSRISDLETDVEQKANKSETYTKEEVDALVEQAKPADYEEVKERVTNLEYENRIIKAVIKKKIAEETEATGSVIPFPSTGEDGYPLAEWGELKMLKGKTWALNQLVDPTKTKSASIVGVTVTRNADGSLTVDGTATGNGSVEVYPTEVNIKANHVYHVFGTGYSSGNHLIYIYPSNWGFTIDYDRPFKTTSDMTVGINLYVGNGGVMRSHVFNPKIVDFTTIYGVTEISDVTDAMREEIKKRLAYHPEYTAGTLLDSVYESGVSVGKNIAEEYANYDSYGGSVTTTSIIPKDGYYTYLAEVEGGKTYIVTRQTVGTSRFRAYTFADNPIGASAVSMSGVTADSGTEITVPVPTGAKYIAVACGNANSQRVMVRVSGADESFSPHFTSTLSLSFLNSVPNIGIEGTVIDFEKEEVTWNWGKVDLGTLMWNKASIAGGAYMGFYCTFVGGVPEEAYNKANILCGQFATVSTNDLYVGGYGISYWKPTNMVNVRDSRYEDMTAQEFKEEMTGVMLYYELATPITKTFADLGIVIPPSWDGGKPWIRVETGGTFTVVSTGAPAEATVSFLTDLGGNA